MGSSQDPLVTTYLFLDPHLVCQPGRHVAQIHPRRLSVHGRVRWSSPRPTVGHQYRVSLQLGRIRQSRSIRWHGLGGTAHQTRTRSRRRRTGHEHPQPRFRDDAQDCQITPTDAIDLALLPATRPAYRGPVHPGHQAGGEWVGRTGHAGGGRGGKDFELLERWQEF